MTDQLPGEQVPEGNTEPEQYRSELDRREKLDARDRAAAELALADWRDKSECEYHANLRLINGHLDRMPAEERARYETGTTEDGRRLLNDPATLRKLAAEARDFVPDALKEAAKTNSNERAALESMMADRNSAYWKGRDAETLQARYRDIVRESETVREHLDSEYAKNPSVLERDLAYVREHMNESGFEEKQIARLLARGLSLNRAHAVADYFRQRIQGEQWRT